MFNGKWMSGGFYRQEEENFSVTKTKLLAGPRTQVSAALSWRVAVPGCPRHGTAWQGEGRVNCCPRLILLHLREGAGLT